MWQRISNLVDSNTNDCLARLTFHKTRRELYRMQFRRRRMHLPCGKYGKEESVQPGIATTPTSSLVTVEKAVVAAVCVRLEPSNISGVVVESYFATRENRRN
jgi:hypothetical protein